MIKIEIGSKAANELFDAVEWYYVQKPGLEKAFYHELKRFLNRISQRPLSFPIFVSSFRKALLGKFPFMVIFHFEPNETKVVVLSIWHTSRDPEQLMKTMDLYQ